MADGTETSPEPIEAHLAEHGRVSFVAIPARDPITSAVFYEAVFGWTITPTEDERVWWTLGPRDNHRVPFSDTTTGLIGAFVADRGPTGDGVLLHIYVDGIEGIVQEIEARDLEVIEPVREERGMKVALFRDPGRNVIGIWEAKPQAT